MHTYVDDSGAAREYHASTAPGVQCSSCQGLWGRTFHPADRPCTVVPAPFYVTTAGALRPQVMMPLFGSRP